MMSYKAGIDIGGTRIKLGIVQEETGQVVQSEIFDTCRSSEEKFLLSIRRGIEECLKKEGAAWKQLSGCGVSIGSYVFADGTIDGMSSFVPFMTEGYPLVPNMEAVLKIPVRADNDARLIGLAETKYGAGKGYARTLTMTLGTGVGIGICVDGKPMGDEPFFHLAGHIKVRTGGEISCLDSEPCYCGLRGCFESTCSGISFEKYVKQVYGEKMTNQRFFEMAAAKESGTEPHIEFYLHMLTEALNQYIYCYCPDVIILGGGVAKGLVPWLDEIQKHLVAHVHYHQRTVVRVSELMENSGILGAASLF